MSFLRASFSSDRIRDEVLILGVGIFTLGAPDVGQSQQASVCEGLAMAARLARAPVATHVREMLYQTRIIPEVTWGWWVNDIPLRLQSQNLLCFSESCRCSSHGVSAAP